MRVSSHAILISSVFLGADVSRTDSRGTRVHIHILAFCPLFIFWRSALLKLIHKQLISKEICRPDHERQNMNIVVQEFSLVIRVFSSRHRVKAKK